VLLVPDSTYWITGTIAKSIARFNPWIESTIASGPVLDTILRDQDQLKHNFDLVHFICPYASKEWLPHFRELMPCITSHHHVTDWELVKHNLAGDAIVVGSPEWSYDLQARGADPDNIFCVPYGVDADLFTPASVERRALLRGNLGISAGSTVVGFFGKNSSNDDDRKGIDVFIKAIVALAQKLPELNVLIIGPGWKDLVESLRVAGSRCLWFPFIRDYKDLADMYRVLDFYWVTARVEGGPVTLLEAMSTEVCCLTTPVGLAKEITRDGQNGVLLPFNDADAFAIRTATLAADQNERERLGRNARQTILEEMHVAVTSRGVAPAYAKAFANFAHRHDSPAGVDVTTLAEQACNDSVAKSEVPLNGFPTSLHRRVRMLEALYWSEHLVLYHQQRGAALKLILSEWLRNPFSLLPPRVLLRRFLPVFFVARIVKLKNRSAESHIQTA
jgi:glycosyltransferase involved in cell wall biosynthesis